MQVFKFRNCLLNTVERSVIKDREHVDLTTKTFDVLQYLIENAGRIVSKDEILGHVWNGDFVEESNLPVHISKLRRSLGEERGERYIETVQGTGYRFVAPVQEVGKAEWCDTAAENANRPELLNDAIAVLPLFNQHGGEKYEYVVDGLTESLINGLSHVRGLKVIAGNTTFRYKDKEVDVREVGSELAVSRILTGRIKVIDENVEISVELINAQDRTQIWGCLYNRPFSDILELSREVVRSVAALTTTTTAALAASGETGQQVSAESYKFYLMGKYLLSKRTTQEIYKALKYFRKSVARCPTNILANVAIVDAYHFLHALDRISRVETLLKIKPVLERLSSMEQEIDVVQLMYGKLKLHLDWKLEIAEKHVHKALTLNPNCVDAHFYYAEIMALSGNQLEAERHVDQILALDPISLLSIKRVGRIFYQLHQYERCIECLNDAYEMESSDFETLLLLGAAFAELGDYSRALRLLKKSYSCHEGIETLSMIGYVEGLRGRKDRANRIIERITSELQEHTGHPIHLGRVYLAMGCKEEAYLFLEEAFQQHEIEMVALGVDLRWRTIMDEPRFKELIRRVRESPERLK